MKVLLLPVNIASDISHKVRSLRKLGVDARGFSVVESPIQSVDEVRVFRIDFSEGEMARWRRRTVYARMWRMIAWADVLHWVADASVFAEGKNYKFLRFIGKPGVVQWIGSDIRIPQIDLSVNPYYKRAFDEGYEYVSEGEETSRANQEFAASLNFYPLEFVGMNQYIDEKLFPKRFRTWQSVVLADHEPRYPSANNARPLIVHSPSAPVAKGTRYVVEAVERLKARYDFDFKLVENVERKAALEIMRGCDVYVDQLILGAHGYAAVEAMAFGKPVVCYINPSIGKDYPADLPVINANPDNIEEVLERLIVSGTERSEHGRRSRTYVEKYHDDEINARRLVEIYREVIDLHRKKR